MSISPIFLIEMYFIIKFISKLLLSVMMCTIRLVSITFSYRVLFSHFPYVTFRHLSFLFNLSHHLIFFYFLREAKSFSTYLFLSLCFDIYMCSWKSRQRSLLVSWTTQPLLPCWRRHKRAVCVRRHSALIGSSPRPPKHCLPSVSAICGFVAPTFRTFSERGHFFRVSQKQTQCDRRHRSDCAAFRFPISHFWRDRRMHRRWKCVDARLRDGVQF